MKKILKNKIEYCGLNYRTEILKIISFNSLLGILDILFFILQFDIKTIVALILSQMVMNYILLSRYNDKAKILDEERENEFVTVISYFEIFITNKNNVYQSFNKIIPYCTEWMKNVVSNLLKEIDEDKTVQPFVNFANNFKIKIATNIMLSIYSMIDQGETFEQINQFQILFEQLYKSKQIENLEKKKRSLSTLASLPLVGAGGITVLLTISVISVIGVLINVI